MDTNDTILSCLSSVELTHHPLLHQELQEQPNFNFNFQQRDGGRELKLKPPLQLVYHGLPLLSPSNLESQRPLNIKHVNKFVRSKFLIGRQENSIFICSFFLSTNRSPIIPYIIHTKTKPANKYSSWDQDSQYSHTIPYLSHMISLKILFSRSHRLWSQMNLSRITSNLSRPSSWDRWFELRKKRLQSR